MCRERPKQDIAVYFYVDWCCFGEIRGWGVSDFKEVAHRTVAELFDMLKEKQYTVDALSEINHEKDLEIADLKTQLNNMEACYIEKKKQVEGQQKQIDEISTYATELAEYASYAEIIGAVSHNRPVIREYCDKIFAYNRAIDIEEEKALRGEHE